MNDCYQILKKNGTETRNFAFLPDDEILFSLRIREADSVCFYLGNDEKVLLSSEVPFVRVENGFRVYEHTLRMKDVYPDGAGLFFFHWEAETKCGRVYSVEEDNRLILSDRFTNEFQITVYSPEYNSPTWLDNGVFYHVFVDRFYRSGKSEKREDAVYRDDWDDAIPEYPRVRGQSYPNNTHFGGDLYGVAEKLDYLQDLGVTTLYLSPVCDAFSNHKYDTGDYLSVDRSFGGDEALRFLCGKCHERGMHVILDGVFNHVGNDSVYFNRYGKYSSLGAYQSKDSPYYPWFRFTNFPEQYECWWGIRNLPQTGRNKEFQNFICEQVIPKYMDLGADGFRLDVVDELDSAFVEQITAAAKAKKSDAAVIGEVWEDASNKIAYDERRRYFQGKQLDGVMNYPLRNGMLAFLKDGDSSLLRYVTDTLYCHYPPDALAHTMNNIGTHDTERILTILGSEGGFEDDNDALAVRKLSPEARARAIRLLAMGFELFAAIPGVPCIYYGDEAGMEGYHDPFNRRPFPWNRIDGELYDRFRRINRLRSEEPLFASRVFEVLNGPEGTFDFRRGEGDDFMTVLSNRSGKDLFWHFDTPVKELLSGGSEQYDVTVPNDTTMIFRSVVRT